MNSLEDLSRNSVLFNDTLNCQGYRASVIDTWMYTERRWEGTDRRWSQNPVRIFSHMKWPGFSPGSLRWEAWDRHTALKTNGLFSAGWVFNLTGWLSQGVRSPCRQQELPTQPEIWSIVLAFCVYRSSATAVIYCYNLWKTTGNTKM